MSEVPEDVAFLHWLKTECGIIMPKPLIEKPGWYAGIARKAFTHSILLGRFGDRLGYEDCWCYSTLTEAMLALTEWDGRGEPVGWTRHPTTGRRISQYPNERDSAGREVGMVGVMYVRH